MGSVLGGLTLIASIATPGSLVLRWRDKRLGRIRARERLRSDLEALEQFYNRYSTIETLPGEACYPLGPMGLESWIERWMELGNFGTEARTRIEESARWLREDRWLVEKFAGYPQGSAYPGNKNYDPAAAALTQKWRSQHDSRIMVFSALKKLLEPTGEGRGHFPHFPGGGR